MVLEVVCEIVEKKALFLPLLDVLDHPDVQVHHERVDLARLPVLPQPSGYVKQERLKKKKNIF